MSILVDKHKCEFVLYGDDGDCAHINKEGVVEKMKYYFEGDNSCMDYHDMTSICRKKINNEDKFYHFDKDGKLAILYPLNIQEDVTK